MASIEASQGTEKSKIATVIHLFTINYKSRGLKNEASYHMWRVILQRCTLREECSELRLVR